MTPAAQTLRPFMAKEWKALAGSGASTVVLAVAELAKPWPLAIVIDHVIRGREGAFTLTADDVRLLIAVAALAVGIALTDAAATYASDLWLQRAGERITHDLRVAVYDHLQRLSLAFHQSRQKGDLLTRVTGDVNAVGDLFSQSLGRIAQEGLLLIGMILVVLWLDPLLALVAFATTPVLAAVSFVYRRRVKATARQQRAQEGRIASMAGETLSAMPVVKAFGSEQYEGERVRRGSEERMAIGVEVARLQARFDGMAGVLSASGMALVLVVGVLRVAAGALSPGDLLVLATYARKTASPLRVLARETTKVARAMARAERIAELLSVDERLEDRPGAYRGGRARGDVVLEDVSFSYAPDRPVLSELSVHIPAGARVAVMGPSGAGKSTLGALIARFYDPTSGRVVIDGRDARDCTLAWLREQVGVVLQDTVLFTGTVEENIAYATDADHEQVVDAARRAAAHDFITQLPDGYATELGPQGMGLSVGQRQRIGIARTLLRDPPILVLDEPTASLDAGSEAHVIEGLWSLMRDRTTILVTHSLELARSADRVLVMEGGDIAGDGAPGAVLPRDRAAKPRPGPPRDPALPLLPRLLDPDDMAPVLQRSLGRDVDVDDVRIGRVVYRPAELVAVHYRTTVAGTPHDAVVTSIAGVDLEGAASKPRYAQMARTVDGRSPAAYPLRYDGELEAIVSWLPFDPRLPGLAEPPSTVARLLREAGLYLPESPGEPVLIGYKPRARAVLRLGQHVLKAYGTRRRYDVALAGLRAASLQAGVPTADCEAAFPGLRLTVQSAVEGDPPADANVVAAQAGALVRELQRSSVSAVPAAQPDRELAACARKAAVIEVVLPGLRSRLDALLRRLGESMPRASGLVPAHGDFHVDQLLERHGRLTVVDFDGLCIGPPALDLATYAADVVRGRGDDAARIEAVTQPLLDGFEGRPEAFDWHLAAAILGRAAHPFQRQVPDWPACVEATIAAAEASVAQEVRCARW